MVNTNLRHDMFNPSPLRRKVKLIIFSQSLAVAKFCYLRSAISRRSHNFGYSPFSRMAIWHFLKLAFTKPRFRTKLNHENSLLCKMGEERKREFLSSYWKIISFVILKGLRGFFRNFELLLIACSFHDAHVADVYCLRYVLATCVPVLLHQQQS